MTYSNASKEPRSPLRRRVIAAGLAATAASAWSPARSQGTTVIRQGIFVGTGLPGIYAAIDRGYFAAEGIELKLQQFGSGPAFMAALVGGSLDITHADVLAWATAVGGGRDVVLIAGGSDAQTPDGDLDGATRIVAKKGSGIQSPKDLVGKSIAVGASQLTIATTKAWLEQAGVDPDKVSYEIVAQGAGIPPLLRNGTVAAAQFGDPVFDQVGKDLELLTLGWPTRYLPPGALYTGLFSTKKFIDANPELIRRYVRAYRKGAAYFNRSSPAERARLVLPGGVDIAGLEKSGLTGLTARFRYNRAAETPVNLAATQTWIDTAARYKSIPAKVDVSHAVHLTAVETVR